MLALNLCICDYCGKVYKADDEDLEVFVNRKTPLSKLHLVGTVCISCEYNSIKGIDTKDSLNVAKNKKNLEIILADTKNKIKEQFGVEA